MAERECGNDAAAYALGALAPTEAASFARHLETCAVCRDEVAAFGLVVDTLPLSAPYHEASRALRRRVLRAVRAEPRTARSPRPRWAARPRPALAGALVVLVALAFATGIELGTSGTNTHLIRATVGDAEISVGGGRAALIVQHLPPPGAGRIYELWLQRGAAAPSPSTLFSVGSRGTADIGVPGTLHGLSRVLVTDEPASGSRSPTGRALIVAALS
jgi:Anti-sigma-K factor rskA/Putative zinc-finger